MGETAVIVRAPCPTCGSEKNATVLREHSEVDEHGDSGVWGRKDFRILKCGGCGTSYFQIETTFSEIYKTVWDEGEQAYVDLPIPEFTHYPTPSIRDAPEWVCDLKDAKLVALLEDVYGTLNAGLLVPAAVATRTAFDRGTEALNVDPDLPFGRKLTTLYENGHISEGDKEALSTLIEAGSAAAHRGWQPTLEQLHSMVHIMETFLRRNFVERPAAEKLARSVPARRERPQKRP